MVCSTPFSQVWRKNFNQTEKQSDLHLHNILALSLTSGQVFGVLFRVAFLKLAIMHTLCLPRRAFKEKGPGTVAHVCNSSYVGGRGRWITWAKEFQISLVNMVKLHLKNTKISWAWWRMTVIPATQEAEAGESLQSRDWRLQWAKITSLHFSGDRARLCLEKIIK